MLEQRNVTSKFVGSIPTTDCFLSYKNVNYTKIVVDTDFRQCYIRQVSKKIDNNNLSITLALIVWDAFLNKTALSRWCSNYCY